MRFGLARISSRDGWRRNALREPISSSEKAPSKRLIHDHWAQSISEKSSLGVSRASDRIARACEGKALRNDYEYRLWRAVCSLRGTCRVASSAWNRSCVDGARSKIPRDEGHRHISFEEL